MLTQRSTEKEFIDLELSQFTQQDYEQYMKKLFMVNKILGIFAHTKRLLKKFPADSSLLDVGCGNGLFILQLSQYFPNMRMKGMDVSSAAIQAAQHELAIWQQNHPKVNVAFELQDRNKLLIPKNSVDIILANVVCHHLNDEELIAFLSQSVMAARKAVIINDLHRHFLAYKLFKFISPIFLHNKLMTHDGLISIQRGFTRADWHILLERAGIKNYQLKWCFPFRWSVVCLLP